MSRALLSVELEGGTRTRTVRVIPDGYENVVMHQEQRTVTLIVEHPAGRTEARHLRLHIVPVVFRDGDVGIEVTADAGVSLDPWASNAFHVRNRS